ncbi:amidohydrolase family protein, partial [Clostridiaceae bacterium OttesenSCG-928-D20]|nr:amidohydrolase family protein [Clostridiaceae bacterium OttesenSCG-928-D20]
KSENMRLQVHLSETKSEHLESISRRGMTPARWFEHLGLFDVPAIAAHCVWIDDSDIEILAKKGVFAAHCPSSNLKLGSGIAPIKKLRDAGVKVTIGTDGAASNNNLNMLEEVNLAAILHKGANQDPLFISKPELLKMACRNGALAQGRADCGSIKIGNRADIFVVDANSPHMRPLINPLSNIIYSAQSSDIVLNIVDGKVLYKDGEYLTLDIERIIFEAERIAEEKLALL